MALPKLTAEQRSAALELATQSRRRRAEIKAGLKHGTITVSKVLELADKEPFVAKMRVSSILEAMPRIGAVTSSHLLADMDISESRRLRGLGSKQRAELIRRFG